MASFSVSGGRTINHMAFGGMGTLGYMINEHKIHVACNGVQARNSDGDLVA